MKGKFDYLLLINYTRKMDNSPLLTVVVPVYNIEEFLEKSVNSIINQSYNNLEIILVDDGSIDNSGIICDSFAALDQRVRVIHKKNEGLVSARKAGLVESKGDFITYVDGDDWIEADMYEKLMLKISDSDMIVCGVYRDYNNITFCEVNKIEDGIYNKNDLEKNVYNNMIYSGDFFERKIQPHVYNVIFRREILYNNQIQIDNIIRVGEDAACFYPAILDADKVVFTSECFYHYQMRNNSIMGINDGYELKRYKMLYYYLKKRFCENHQIKDSLINQLEYLMIYVLLLKEIKLLQTNQNNIFPFSKINKGNKIIVYGAGRFGSEFVRYVKQLKEYTFILWIDKNTSDEVEGVEKINSVEFDYILVAVLLKEIADKIVMELLENKVPESKILKVSDKEIDKMKLNLDKILL